MPFLTAYSKQTTMIHRGLPQENWLQKGVRVAEQGLKIWGTAQGLYQAGSALATGVRSAYQVAAPLLAAL